MTGIIPFEFTSTSFDNGLKLITMPMPSPGLASFWTVVRTGARDEFEPGRSGFAHFFEHMMFRGTERYPSEVYQKRLTEIGADGNAYTTDDLTAYHIAVTPDDLDRVMDLESDRFRHLHYSEQDFKTEAGAVYGEYRKSKTEPLFVLYEAVRAAAFERHTYGHTTLGFEKDIAAMPSLYEFSKGFFSRYYRPENAVLFVAGDVDPERVLALAEKHYGAWEPGYQKPSIPDEPPQASERVIDVKYDGQTLPLLWVAYKLGRFDPSDRVRVAADLLVELAYGSTSDTYRRLVLKEQSVEYLAAYTNTNRDPSVLDIYSRVKSPDQVDAVRQALDEAAAQYRHTPVERSRLEALKKRLRYEFLMRLETPDAVAQALARPIALSGNLDGLEQLHAAYATITPEEIQAAANQLFVPEQRTVGLLQAAR